MNQGMELSQLLNKDNVLNIDWKRLYEPMPRIIRFPVNAQYVAPLNVERIFPTDSEV